MKNIVSMTSHHQRCIAENFVYDTIQYCIAKYLILNDDIKWRILASYYQHSGIFRPQHCATMLQRGIFRQWRHIINIASRNILFKASHKRYCILENFVSGMINIASQNISSMASHYQCCIAEYLVHSVTCEISRPQCYTRNISFVIH